MRSAPTILWYRGHDLRVADNPALEAAAEGGGRVLPVFVWSPEEGGDWRPGAGSRWWLRRSLERLSEDLRGMGSGLLLVDGPAPRALSRLAEAYGAGRLIWNRSQTPDGAALEAQVSRQLGPVVETVGFDAARLAPASPRTRSGEAFRVFTPFCRRFLSEVEVPRPIEARSAIPPPGFRFPEEARAKVLDAIAGRAGGRWGQVWTPGEAGARARLERFLSGPAGEYSDAHDRMDRAGTSSLSPYLAFGEISVREVWNRVSASEKSSSREAFLRQLVWREFAYEQLKAFPQMTDAPLRTEFASMETSTDTDAFERWKAGETGYPVVDAGMRQLAVSGWMHNRARMVVASFLTKHLGLPWQWGAHWFWNRLVDADLANNSLNWQWAAGTGVDAAPYYRIFNPTRQGVRFDPAGDYVRTWVPELRAVGGAAVHGDRGRWHDVVYPGPVVRHGEARAAALGRYRALRERQRESLRR